jgi:tRNA1Val (adenine37-N6)-methyltransferase
MPNSYFDFKQFRINQAHAAFKVGTDGVLLGAWAGVPEQGKILDVGTGTGLIALMAAQRTSSIITAIEPDPASYSEAEANVKDSRWSDRITVLNTTLQELVELTDEKFDHIISNPPFFSVSLPNKEDRVTSARHTITLNATDFLEASDRLLKPDGKLSLILPYAEGNLFIVTASAYGLYCSRMTRIKPLPEKSVRRLLMEFSRNMDKLKSDYLVIEKGKRHDYTSEYISLTRDFYLDF